MNNFNKLYNLILQSIITEGRAQFAAAINKYNKNSIKPIPVDQTVNQLVALNNNKLATYFCKLLVHEVVKSLKDSRLAKVQKIVKNDNTFNLEKYGDDLDQLINQNYMKLHLQQIKQKYSNPDNIKQFTNKQECGNGIVVYQIQDNKNGMLAVRYFIDATMSPSTNPWCLVGRVHDNDFDYFRAWDYWKHYNAYPKLFAIKKGKPFAFCANNKQQILWWNINDRQSPELKDGQRTIRVKTPNFYTTEQKNQLNLNWIKNMFAYNQQTKKYDYLNKDDNDILTIKQSFIGDDGKLVIPLGTVKCSLSVNGILKLKTLQNFPERVEGDFYIIECDALTNLQGAPKYVNGQFGITECTYLQSLKGSPIECNNFYCSSCDKLESFQGAPQIVHNKFKANYCAGIKSLKGSPKKTGGSYVVYMLPNLQSLVGGPEEVGYLYQVSHCKSLTNLIGMPKKIKGKFTCHSNAGLKSLQGLTQDIDEEYDIQDCPYLDQNEVRKVNNSLDVRKSHLNKETGRWDVNGSIKITDPNMILNGHLGIKLGVVKGNFTISPKLKIKSLQNGPTKVEGNYIVKSCIELTNLKGAPEEVGGSFYCSDCYSLTSLKGAPRKVGDTFGIDGCVRLQNLQGSPDYVGGDYFAPRTGITTTKGISNTVKGNLNISFSDNLKQIIKPVHLGGEIINKKFPRHE